MKNVILFLIALALSAFSLRATDCPAGVPLPDVPGTEKICHVAYASLYDAKLHVPRVVAYELTGAQSLGCQDRATGFHAEPHTAFPSHYDNSGYDLGHLSPAQDNAYSKLTEYESFSTANIAPQLPGLNRQEWERLEESVRSWALGRGDLLIYVGPVISDKPAMMKDVGVPSSFWKVIVDRKTGDVLAFEMPQKDLLKGPLEPWLTTVKAIEQETGIQLPVKGGSQTVWPFDLAGWHAAHKKACGKE